MRNLCKSMLWGVAGACALALAATAAHAQLAGDLNNDGQVGNADVNILTSCALGSCSPAAATLCGGVGLGNVITGSSPPIRCGDTFGDGNTTTQINNDLGVLTRIVARLPIDYTPPGASIGSIHSGCPTNPADPLPACVALVCNSGVRNGLVCADDTDCPTVNASADITTSEIWPRNCRVNLTDTVEVVTAGAVATVLTIESNSTVVGDVTAAAVPALIIGPGSRIVAQGTEAQPIRFTSNNPPRAANDWGGVSLLGRSTVNRPGCVNEAEGIPFQYGGCITDDNSGVISYARIEFAGRLFTPDNELNNFTMNAVGSGTRLSYIQAHFGADDCIEWFGGTVDGDHFVASACGDDGFDWQLGFTGSLQYGLFIQNAANLSAGASQSRGIEADNSEFGFDDLPRSKPGMCNLTLIGTTSASGTDRGILFRRGTAGNLANLIVANWKNEGVNLNDSSTSNAACVNTSTLTNDLTISSSIFHNTGASGTTHAAGSPGGNCSTSAIWYGLQSNMANAVGSNAVNPAVAAYPASGELFNTTRPGASAFTVTAGACSAIRDTFQDTSYPGAFDPGLSCTPAGLGAGTDCDWLSKPWNNFDLS